MQDHSTKQCKFCRQFKSFDCFSTYDNGYGLRPRNECRECRNAYNRSGRAKRPKPPPTDNRNYVRDGKKKCKGCEQTLPLDSFHTTTHKNGKEYPHSYCKECLKKQTRTYLASPAGKKLIRRRNLRTYGVTIEQYDALFASQGGLCAICGRPETHVSHCTKEVRRLSVDHDHTTGKVRGLLCGKCNRAMGMLGDDIPRLRTVLSYLEKAGSDYAG